MNTEATTGQDTANSEERAPYIVSRPPYVAPTEEKKAFLKALAAAQGAYEPIVKNTHVVIDGKEGKRGYAFDYADLAEILNKTRKALSANGLSLRSTIEPDEGGVWLTSILAHEAGYEDVSRVFLQYGEDIKQFGGRISYMRRYLGAPQLGIASEGDIEDDGEGHGEIAFRDRTPAPAPAQRAKPAPRAAAKAAAAQGNGQGNGQANGHAAATSGPAGDEPPPEGQAATGTEEVLEEGQQKYILNKLKNFYTEAEVEKWLADRGITDISKVPASHFNALKKEVQAF
jgi:hypothetical protein